MDCIISAIITVLLLIAAYAIISPFLPTPRQRAIIIPIREDAARAVELARSEPCGDIVILIDASADSTALRDALAAQFMICQTIGEAIDGERIDPDGRSDGNHLSE